MKKIYLAISIIFIILLTWASSVEHSSAQTTNSSSIQTSPISGILKISSVPVNYQIRGGLILNATLDNDIKSIILELDGYNTTISPDEFGSHYIELWIPHKLLDTPSSDNFTVTVNGQVVPTAQFPQKIEPRAVVIPYNQGLNVVSITGTRTVYDVTNSVNQTTPSVAQNNVKSSNDPFSIQVISTIIFGIVIIIGIIFLVRKLVKKKPNL